MLGELLDYEKIGLAGSACGTMGWTHRCRCLCHLWQTTHTQQVRVAGGKGGGCNSNG